MFENRNSYSFSAVKSYNHHTNGHEDYRPMNSIEEMLEYVKDEKECLVVVEANLPVGDRYAHFVTELDHKDIAGKSIEEILNELDKRFKDRYELENH